MDECNQKAELLVNIGLIYTKYTCMRLFVTKFEYHSTIHAIVISPLAYARRYEGTTNGILPSVECFGRDVRDTESSFLYFGKNYRLIVHNHQSSRTSSGSRPFALKNS